MKNRFGKIKISIGMAVLLLSAIGRGFAETDLDWENGFTGPETFWGTETNGIKMALMIDPLVSSNNIPIRCTPVIKSSIIRTNRLHTIFLYFPPLKNCYQMNLKDAKGNMVSKTDKGKSLWKPITEPLMLKHGMNMQAGYGMRPMQQNRSELFCGLSFNLQDYFVITNAGKYQLTYQMRVILPQTNKEYASAIYTKNFPVLTLPSVVAEIEIKGQTNSTAK